MSYTLATPTLKPKRRSHPKNMKELGDAASAILQRHAAGEIDASEAARLLEELSLRDRTFLDLLVG
ncbi:hypothetical protein [Aureimonas sp. D3]|uniref:hypothetical protein n=1 Tax=Aureimonas sp. D3 TaxID=1638164 RepID=UPI0012E3CF4D|nr:hypothetical protein [Aureimonas sp. D3]